MVENVTMMIDVAWNADPRLQKLLDVEDTSTISAFGNVSRKYFSLDESYVNKVSNGGLFRDKENLLILELVAIVRFHSRFLIKRHLTHLESEFSFVWY